MEVEKKRKISSIQLTKDTKDILMRKKIDKGYRSVEEVIKELLETKRR